MFHFRVLQDERIAEAVRRVQAEAPTAGIKPRLLDIISVILAHLPELLPLLGDKAALVKAIIDLLKNPQPLPTPTPAA